MNDSDRVPSLLAIALRAILREVEGPRRYSADSYLPAHLAELARAALILEGERKCSRP
jgi:hypothetical protein